MNQLSIYAKISRAIFIGFACSVLLFPQFKAEAGDGVLWISEEHSEGYDRKLFKHWVDADGDGCNTRAEVLLQEAKVKPKIASDCKLIGGTWLSIYDGITYKDSSKLDIDHTVPLAEAWRSGAWKWSPERREEFANYLDNEMALNAITASLNRSKGDRDIASWLPKKNICTYLKSWVAIKSQFELHVDAAEAIVIGKYYKSCGLGYITKPYVDPNAVPTVSSSTSPTQNIVYEISEMQLALDKLKFGSSLEAKFRVKSNDSSPQPIYCLIDMVVNPFEAILTTGDRKDGVWTCTRSIPSIPLERNSSGRYEVQVLVVYSQNGQREELRKSIAVIQELANPAPSLKTVTPGAFCSQEDAGKTGKNSSGTIYTCKKSTTEDRLRWRL